MKNILIILFLFFSLSYDTHAFGSHENELRDDIIEYDGSTLSITISRYKHRIRDRYLSNIAMADLYLNETALHAFFLRAMGRELNQFYYEYDRKNVKIIFSNVLALPNIIYLQGAPVIIEIKFNIENRDNIIIESISSGFAR
jgi:hypothetical protein